MPLVDFQQYVTDIYFSIDQGSHTSREGWVYVDQTLDDLLITDNSSHENDVSSQCRNHFDFMIILGLIGLDLYPRSLEGRYVNALAPLDLTQTINGIALQRAALYQSDLLPVYGSSEITIIDTPYDAEKFFATYPTGFTVFQVANLGAASLTMAQDLAALGPDLHGKKIVISFSPTTFTMSELPQDYYAGNFSPLHAYEMIFSPYLSSALKIDAAKRMLDFPATLQNESFLDFAIIQLTSTSRANRILYDLSWPLGELQIMTMRLQDHAEVVSYLWSHPSRS